jgi:hypothetical protein
MYVRFEGPSRPRFRRWHVVEGSAAGRPVTLCGRYVGRDDLLSERGPGLACRKCREAAARRAETGTSTSQLG